MVDKNELKKLYDEYVAEFDQDEAGETWESQSEEFRTLWDERVGGKEKLSEEELNRAIQFLDSHAKGIGESDIEAACNPVIPQGSWYRIFEEFQANKKLYNAVSDVLRCDSDDELVDFLNKLYSINTEKNRLTGRNATMINDLMFVYAPDRNVSVVSLSQRFKMMEAFGLGDSAKIKSKSPGEQIVFSKNALIAFAKEYPFKNLRSLSCFFYEVRELWDDQPVVASADLDFNERLEEEGFFDIPVADRKIITSISEPEIKSLCEKIDKGKLVARADFQRNYIWDTKPKLKSRLIESVLLRVPIPVIYTAEQDDGKELVVDGQQRLLTFYNFTKKDGFRLKGLRVLKELNGKNYSELGENLQDAIGDYPIRIIKILKESHKDIKFDIFERLNRGSVKLNEQELRNCIYRGSFNDLLKTLVKNKDFQRIQGLKDTHHRMIDAERILRFFAFCDLTERKYKGPLTSFLNNYMESHREISEKQKEDKTATFKKSVELCQTVFGDLAFRRWQLGDDEDANGYREDKINEGIMDVQMYAFTQYDKRDLVGKATIIKDAFIDLMTKDRAFIESIERGTYDTNRVKLRTEKWFQKLREIVGYPEKDRRLYTFEEKKALFDSSNICHICGNEIAFIDDAHVDHLERYSEGGKTSIKNGKLSHRYCNLQKG
ncbi:MAG: DUF262 domain-containing protein [Deltaproteobacteria bacterium]|nr:DUF262 domain-containing protein [Deltaproteobacteria bacterium]